MKTPFLLSITALAGVVLLSGCSDFNRAVGKAKSAPDEFQVVVRPPLTLPPNFNFRPDDEEAVEPAGNDAVSVTDQVLTRSATTEVTGLDSLFAFDEIEPDIRTAVDEETIGIQIEKRLPIQILFGGTPNVGPNLVSDEEALRIRKALSAGDDITATPTPAVDPQHNTPLAIE